MHVAKRFLYNHEVSYVYCISGAITVLYSSKATFIRDLLMQFLYFLLSIVLDFIFTDDGQS